jgi:uroporphyrinogen decarboxylase
VNDRERTLAILNYQDTDRLPIVHFGYWNETLDKWAAEGHITPEQARMWADGNAVDAEIAASLGFDFNWACASFGVYTGLLPPFETRVLEELPDGSRKVVNGNGVVIIEKEGAAGIPPEVDHLLKSRREWEVHFLPRLQLAPERAWVSGQQLDDVRTGRWAYPVQVWCGSLYGYIRDWVGMVNLAYLQADDPTLFEEMIDTLGGLSFECVKRVLEQIPADVALDYGHFWEDICFKSGPLVNPRVFRAKVGPHYRRITDLLRSRGINLVSLDCDGLIDALLPVWLENGVNVMFPIEVGTWNASIAPWRAKYGRELRGVGGMDKRVFARDTAAIDAEIERLKPLVALGGYIPCPDHRLAPDAKWENVQYYCDKMRKTFGG